MNKQQIIFTDLDGPVLETKLRHYRCYTDIIEEGGGKPLPLDEYWMLKRNKVNRREMLQKSAYRRSYDDFFSAWLERIEKPEYLQLDELKPGAAEILCVWGEKYPVVLATMRQSDQALRVELTNLGVISLFAQIYCCDYREESAKYKALQHIPFSRAIFIGDSEEDSKTAQLLGIPFLFIETGLRERKYINTPHCYKEIAEIDIGVFLE